MRVLARHSRPSGSRRAATLAVTLVAAFAFCSSSALAATATTHPFITSFDGAGTPNGPFGRASLAGLAVDLNNGHVVVSEQTSPGEPAVDILTSTGGFIAQISVASTQQVSYGFQPRALAVDNSASAANGRIYLADIGSEKYKNTVAVFDPSGNFLYRLDGSNTPAGSFIFPGAVAVDSTGKIYVLDGSSENKSHDVIDIFDPSGNYLSQLSGPHIDGHITSMGLDSAGNIYAATQGGIAKFNSAGVYQLSFGTSGIEKISVDQLSGDIYAAEGRYIAQYDSAGNLLGRFGLGHLDGGIQGVAVNSTLNRVYAIDRHEPGNRVAIFGASASVTVPEATVEATDGISYFDATFHGSVDPEGVPTSFHFEYRRTGERGWDITPEQSVGAGSEPVAVDATVHDLQKGGLANGQSYEVRLVATNSTADASTISSGVDTFTTLAVPLPAATVQQPNPLTATTAHLRGTLSLPAPGFETKYTFTYSGEGGAGGGQVSGSAGSGPGEVAVSADISGLAPNSKYTVQLTASNAGGSSTSAPLTFTTAAAAPGAETVPVGLVTQTSARLGGWVNPQHSPTSYWLEYGTDTGYGTITPPLPGASAGSGLKWELFTEDISGLEANTTYHYRVVAENSIGTTQGPDLTFTTVDPDAPGPPDRGMELVNNPEKGNQPVLSRLVAGGQKVIWGTVSGAPSSPSGSAGLFTASRSADGWHSQAMLPPSEQQLGGGTRRYAPFEVSEDGEEAIYMIKTFLSEREFDFSLGSTSGGPQQALGDHYRDEEEINQVMFATPNFSHVFFNPSRSLQETDTDKSSDLYTFDFDLDDWRLIGLLPDESDSPCPVKAASVARGTTTDVDADTKVFFLAAPGANCSAPAQLYVRNLETETTTLVSEAPLSGQPAMPEFLRANAEGTTVLFTTVARLAAEDENSTRDIYRRQEGQGAECLTCIEGIADADVEVNPGGGAPARAQPMISADLSYIYFLSERQLDGERGAGGGVGGGSAAGLYLLHEGEITYVATFGNGPERGDFGSEGGRYFQVSADGAKVIFENSLPGTTADRIGNEVFRYDAEADELRCLSCALLGSPGRLRFPSLGIGFLGERVTTPMMSADGSDVVFMTNNRLLASDINGTTDIYEWKNGKVRLITDGVTQFDDNGSASPGGGTNSGLELKGISADGTNVLFAAAARLTGYEVDNQTNAFVARIGSNLPPPPTPPAPCVEDACQGPLQTPPRPSGTASAQFSGPANAPAAKKKAKKKAKKHHRKKSNHRRHKRAAGANRGGAK